VSKKHKHRGQPLVDSGRPPRARRPAGPSTRGAFSKHWKLAKQLYKQEATPANKEFLLNTYLGTCPPAAWVGLHARMAGTVLQGRSANWRQRTMPGRNAWRKSLAGPPEFVQPAMEIMSRSADSAAYCADARPGGGRRRSSRRAAGAEPPSGTAAGTNFDRVLRALHRTWKPHRMSRHGKPCRPSALRSPFMEWKTADSAG